MTIRIFYSHITDRNGEVVQVGGIQNYLLALSEVLTGSGRKVVIYQLADKSFTRKLNHCLIVGIKSDVRKSIPAQIEYIFSKVNSDFESNDMIIWGTDKIAISVKKWKSISIQHGISFDYIPYTDLRFAKFWKMILPGFIYKFSQTGKAAKQFLTCKNVVCVDYNFLNWVRTFMPRSLSENVCVIPNFSKLTVNDNVIFRDISFIHISFCRRFEVMRGVDIMIDIVKEISSKYDDVMFSIFGDGSMKLKIETEIGFIPNVFIGRYGPGESEGINLNSHISIIPTYGSEGTSLSLIEAMAAGSVPVVSNVGGMTNVVIDGFNGFLVNPVKDEFINKLEYLLSNRNELAKLSSNARRTVDMGFSFNSWSEKWITYIRKIETGI